MPVAKPSIVAALPAIAVAAFALGGCSGTTYGTGVSPEEQTVTDVMSIASLAPPKKPPIDYKPRGGIVVPPTAALPPPGSGTATTASASDDPNWPKDPDEARRQRAAAEASRSSGPIPSFILPAGQTSYSVASAGSTADSRAEGRKAWDAMHKGKAGSYDENGNPTRKYLTEPPVTYRQPDPNAPMTEPPKKKIKWNQFDVSKLWPW